MRDFYCVALALQYATLTVAAAKTGDGTWELMLRGDTQERGVGGGSCSADGCICGHPPPPVRAAAARRQGVRREKRERAGSGGGPDTETNQIPVPVLLKCC